MLERVARIVEGSEASGPSSYQELLRGSALSLEDVRPAVTRFTHSHRHRSGRSGDVHCIGLHVEGIMPIR